MEQGNSSRTSQIDNAEVEHVEVETVRIKKSVWTRTRDIIIGIGFVMITFGQFADTKELLTFAYHNFITHFTDQVELENLTEVSVGANPQYIENVFGIAQLIKQSTTNPELEYRYYHAPKYLLGVAIERGRVRGYVVTALRDDFYPAVPFVGASLSEFSFEEYGPFNNQFTTDNTNLVYYLEGQQLGREGMFLNQYVGYIEYAGQFADRTLALNQISALNDELVLGEEDAVADRLGHFRAHAKPNFFVVGDFKLETAADMVLTRFEYQSHFSG